SESAVSGADRRSLPRLPRHFVMPGRLSRHLDTWAAVTVVRGIQGYGKTTAVTSWLRDQPPSVGVRWISGRPGVGEVDDFTDRLALLFDPSLDAGPSRSVAEAPTPLADALALLDRAARATRDGDRLVLVIDDAQLVRDEALLRGLVETVARRQQLHLILCSRGRHPIERLAAGIVETVNVPARDLLLTADEIGLLARRMEVDLTTEQTQHLHTAFGGWVAAIRQVLEHAGQPGEQLPVSRAEDYLRETVLPGIGDQASLTVVMRFALAERLTHRLIRDFAEDHDPETLVRLIESPGLAERRHEHDDVVVVLPSFIRDGLRRSYTLDHPEQARVMHRRLAVWFSRHAGPGHPRFALRHAVAGEHWDLMDRVWLHHANELTLTESAALADVLSSLPPQVLASRPGMRVALEVARAAADTGPDDEGLLTLHRTYVGASRRIARRGSGLKDLPLHDLLLVGTGHLVALRAEGRLAESARAADALERAASAALASGHEPGDRLSWFHLQRGITQLLLTKTAAATHELRLAWQHRRSTSPSVAAHAAANLALTYAITGEGSASSEWLERRREIDTTDSWVHHLADASAPLAAALLALDRLDLDGCEQELARTTGDSSRLELWPYAAFIRAQHGLHRGDLAPALAELDQAQRSHPTEAAPGDAAHLLLTRARVDLLLAESQGEHARSLLTGPGVENAPVLAVPLARLHLLTGEPHRAREIAAHLLWRVGLTHRARLELLLILAQAAHHGGDRATSVSMMGRACGLYRHTGLLRPFAAVPEPDLDVLLTRAGQALAPDDLERLRRTRSPLPRSIELVDLTPRERLLTQALATTASRQEIADRLYVSVNTVRAQLTTLYRKLGVSTREEALVRIADLGLGRSPE
ncbi:LuxR C-terminal-related transcriptional regulator, partial [Nocardioides sp.]|uniref:LuxR C-terminal-related transcriptional regulator n=1 Tax=Nocardioides sp. TaxID=35761 RepID=UPI002733E5DC